ncbi:hypothetical protein MKW92_023270 [Papaver armeniacum]|nr:hypothetical protein MKW92_023270 [Papaver armeniacum]
MNSIYGSYYLYVRLVPFSFSSLTTLLYLLMVFQNCSAKESTMTPTQFITDSQTLTSSGEIFQLGFFSPVNSTNRYVGIWYNKISVKNIVWVANRDRPLKDSSGTLRIANDGNLVISDGRGTILWTTNVSNFATRDSSVAELSDTGNLVFRLVDDNSTRGVLWQSFDNPTDTFLPLMKIGGSSLTGTKQELTSWKDESDPSVGIFSAGLDLVDNIPQLVVSSNASKRLWRSGAWNSKIFIGMPKLESVYNDGFYLTKDNRDKSIYISFDYLDKSRKQRYVLGYGGELFAEIWNEEKSEWSRSWSTQDDKCDTYAICGPNGSCNVLDSPICSCLIGFVPKSEDEWRNGNWSGGCVRKTQLTCRNSSNSSHSDDGFMKLGTMKVPDFAIWSYTNKSKECNRDCLADCSCIAYSYDSGVGCMTWNESLVDMQKFNQSGEDLYIRLAHSDLIVQIHSGRVIIIIVVLAATFAITVCAFFFWKWLAKRRGKHKKNVENKFNPGSIIDEPQVENMFGDNSDHLKVYKFEELAIATNNFNEDNNRLGKGGFGVVYKGKLLDGQEIAVKRLSKGSLQGSEEFKNEVLVISKVQHRNLVRLLGCCIEKEEKMLIYEYLPNKSLDALLFDPTKHELLDWRKRFLIIEGISRGILYLHRDSRLKVIHRDLKVSNILLDEDLNPKISDFGMARIFAGNEHQANTRRVVGTFGYMPPEYLMEGKFSTKSDVFSFGVLLLEVVSGKRSSSFHQQETLASLPAYAWELWVDNKTELLIDSKLLCPSTSRMEILRCIHVGLLCIQEFPKDRPSMSAILSMLTSENATLPSPKQPAYVMERRTSSQSQSDSFPSFQESASINDLTVTNVEGR